MVETDRNLSFSGRYIGAEHPVFVIAEIGQNHQGDLNTAKKMISAASQVGTYYRRFHLWTFNYIFFRLGWTVSSFRNPVSRTNSQSPHWPGATLETIHGVKLMENTSSTLSSVRNSTMSCKNMQLLRYFI